MAATGRCFTILFANCAGGAGGGAYDPRALGASLRRLLDAEEAAGVVAVGLSEGIVSVAPGDGDTVPRLGVSDDLALAAESPELCVDDLAAFAEGFGLAGWSRYYVSLLNSAEHNHPEAVRRKWRAQNGGSRRIADEYQAGRTVHIGNGALLRHRCGATEGIELRPAGLRPPTASEFLGNRDSEPRAAILLRDVPVPACGAMDLAFCQLDTHTGEVRVGPREAVEGGKGAAHRVMQVNRLGQCLAAAAGKAIALLGDFNARPCTKELDLVTETYGFQHVLPSGCSREDFCDTILSERERGLPYTHLGHGTLIDHGFVRELPDGWECRLRILAPGPGCSDHAAVALTVVPH